MKHPYHTKSTPPEPVTESPVEEIPNIDVDYAKLKLHAANIRLEAAKVDEEVTKLQVEKAMLLREAEIIASGGADTAAKLFDEWGLSVTLDNFNKRLQERRIVTTADPEVLTKKGLLYGTQFNAVDSKHPRWYRYAFDALLLELGVI